MTRKKKNIKGTFWSIVLHGTLLGLAISLLYVGAVFAQPETETKKPIYILDVKGVINPFTAKYTLRGIGEAERGDAQLVVIMLNTPGGLDTSMRDINLAILNSDIPIAVYVAPKGARAASAGVFITYSSDIAAMSPGTNIGAAHHVSIGGGGDEDKKDDNSWIDMVLDLYKEAKKREKEKQDTDEIATDDPIESNGTTEDKTPVVTEPEKPVSKPDATVGDESKPLSTQQVMSEKITNDAVAGLRAIAELKGRNADWAEKAIRESDSIPASKAYEIGVVEYLSDSVEELLVQIDGIVITKSKQEHTLNTAGAPVRHVPMSAIESLMLIITDPQIAYFLLMIGIYGLIYEVTHPGAVFPGVIGGTSLVLAIMAFNYLPITAAGVVLLVLGILFMVAEFKAPGIGILAIGGVICFLLGSFLLIDRNYSEMVIRPESYLPMTILSVFLLVIVLPRVYKSMRGKVVTGMKGIQETVGTVVKEISPLGKVYVHGEYWDARTDDGSTLEKDTRIVVVKKDDDEMELIVKKREDKS
jgi:membrane-bound serine protease (ClpP class)